MFKEELLASDSFYSTPSANELPHLLRQKLTQQLQQRQIPVPKCLAQVSLESRKQKVPAEERHYVYTSNELQEELERVQAAIASTQRIIQAGEEAYYEETHAHGNIFVGWDGFIDNREIGSNGNAATGNNHSGSQGRRMAMDYRWCSTSHVSATVCQKGNNIRDGYDQYLPVPVIDAGTPITVMPKEESDSLDELRRAKANETKAASAEKEKDDTDKRKGELSEQTEHQEHEEEEPKANDSSKVEDEPLETKKADRRGKRKASAPPPVSTRPKRTRK